MGWSKRSREILTSSMGSIPTKVESFMRLSPWIRGLNTRRSISCCNHKKSKRVSLITRMNIVLACCFPVLAICNIRAQDNPQSMARNLRHSVVSITAYDKHGKVLIRGNGFFVSATGLILTRRALLPAEAHRTQATLADGTTYRITATWSEDKEADLAMVTVDLS